MKFITVGKKTLNQLFKKLQSNVEKVLEKASQTYKKFANSRKKL